MYVLRAPWLLHPDATMPTAVGLPQTAGMPGRVFYVLGAAAEATPVPDAGDPTTIIGALLALIAILGTFMKLSLNRTVAESEAARAAAAEAHKAQLAAALADRDYHRDRAEKSEAARDAQSHLFAEQAATVMQVSLRAVETNNQILAGMERERAIEKARGERGERGAQQ